MKINDKQKKRIKGKTDDKKLEKRRNVKSKVKKQPLQKKKLNLKLDFKLSKKSITTILVILTIVIIYSILKNYHRIGISLGKNISTEQAIEIETTNSKNIIKEYRSNILVYNPGKITVYNRFGAKKWEARLEEIFLADINTAGKYIQILNKDSGYVYIYANKYEIARIKVEGKIRSGKIQKDGTSVIEYDSIGTKAVLGVYNKKGIFMYEIKLNNNIIGDYALSEGSRFLAYVDVNITGISLSSSVKVIDLNKVDKKGYKVKTISTNNNSLIYRLIWNNFNLVVQLEDEILKYNVFNDKLKQCKLEDKNLLNIYVYNSGYAYIESITEDTGYELNISKVNRKKIRKASIPDSPKHFIYEHGLVYICYQKEINIYNKLGWKIKNYKSDTVISEPIIFNDGKSIAIPLSNKIILFTI